LVSRNSDYIMVFSQSNFFINSGVNLVHNHYTIFQKKLTRWLESSRGIKESTMMGREAAIIDTWIDYGLGLIELMVIMVKTAFIPFIVTYVPAFVFGSVVSWAGIRNPMRLNVTVSMLCSLSLFPILSTYQPKTSDFVPTLQCIASVLAVGFGFVSGLEYRMRRRLSSIRIEKGDRASFKISLERPCRKTSLWK